MTVGNVSESLKKHIQSENKKYSSPSVLSTSGEIDKKTMKSFANLVKRFNSISSSNNVIMKKHIEALNATKGDYSRRNPKILEKVKYMVSFAQDLVRKEPELELTSLGIFVRAWDVLKNPQFLIGCRKAYENMRSGGAETTASFYGVVYTSLALFVEVMTMYLIPYEFQFANGVKPIAMVDAFQKDHKSFVKSVCFGAASLTSFIEHQKNLSQLVVKSIEEEKEKKEKSKEFLPIYIAAIVVVSATLGLFMIRSMFYWFANFKVDVAHLLEFEAELLTNNIRNLKEQYDREQNPENKKRIASIIEKQEKWQEKFIRMSKDVLNEEVKAMYESNDDLELEDSYDSSKDDAGEPEIYL